MKLKKHTDVDPTEGPLLSAMITYSIPIILANIFATLYQSADMMVLSWFSVGNEVASVGASSTIVSLLLSIAIGLGSGGTVILSHLFGISPMPLWHGFCAPTTSVTTVYTEERRRGIASFRAFGFGDISHLYAGGEPAAFAARWCETYDTPGQRR